MKKLLLFMCCFCFIFLVGCTKDDKLKGSNEETKVLANKFLQYDIVPDLGSIIKTNTVQPLSNNLDLNSIPKDYINIVPQLEEVQLIAETVALDGMNMLQRELYGIPETNSWVEFDRYFYAVNKRYSKLTSTENSISYYNYLDMDYEEGRNNGSYHYFYISVVDEGDDDVIYYHSIICDARFEEVGVRQVQFKYIKGKLFAFRQSYNDNFIDVNITKDNINDQEIVYGYAHSGRSNDFFASALDFSIYGNDSMGYFVYENDDDSYLYKDGYRLLNQSVSLKYQGKIGVHVNMLKNIHVTDYEPEQFILNGYDDIHSNITYRKIGINAYTLNDTQYLLGPYHYNDYNIPIVIDNELNEENEGNDVNIYDYIKDSYLNLARNYLDNKEDYRFKAIKTFWPEFDEYHTERTDYQNWFNQKYLTENFLSLEEIKQIPSIEDKIYSSDYDLSDIIMIDSSYYEVRTIINSNSITLESLHSRHMQNEPDRNEFKDGTYRKVIALMNVLENKIYPLIQTDHTEFYNNEYQITMSLDEFKNKFASIPDGKYLSVIYYEKQTDTGWERYGEIYSNDGTQIIDNLPLVYQEGDIINKLIKKEVSSTIPHVFYKFITINSIG